MNEGDRYVKLVEWSDEDGCFIGSCPDLFYGGCHGSDPRAVFDELCRLVDEMLKLYVADSRPLPKPLTGKQFVNAMQQIA